MAAQSRATPIILTRPAAQAARFANALRDQFGPAITIIFSPLLAPRYMRPQLAAGSWSAVIFTSATAVTATGLLDPETRHALPHKAYCVGDHTAEAARAAGFSAISARGNAAALCARVLAEKEPGPLLHLRGETTHGEVADRLCAAGTVTHEAIVYAELPQTLSPAARAALSHVEPVILPVFSPRTAMILKSELAPIRGKAPLVAVAISQATALAMRGIPVLHQLVADQPDAPSMLKAIHGALIAAQAA